MSRTDTVRAEILSSVAESETEAFTTGVLRAAGSVILKKNGVELLVETDKPDLTETLKAMLRALGVRSFEQKTKADAAGKKRYLLSLARGESEELLKRLGILSEGYLPIPGIDFDRIYRTEEKLAFLQGFFAAAGSLSFSDGENGKGYHLEMTAADEKVAEEILRLVAEVGLKPGHRIERKYNYGIYWKDGETIADFLVLTGATRSALELQSAIVKKELRNNLNRQTNLQTANLDKTVNASAETVRDVLYLKETGLLDGLSEAVKRTAEARVAYPEDSMQELAEKLGVTKSGLTHRLIKIKKCASDARKKKV